MKRKNLGKLKAGRVKKYDYSLYKNFKNINKVIRKKFSKNPFEEFKSMGIGGELASKVCDNAIQKKVHSATISIVGKFYDPKVDKPYKGSILYTMISVIIKFVLFLIITIIIRGIFK